jgi:hypothetical protein
VRDAARVVAAAVAESPARCSAANARAIPFRCCPESRH